MKTLYAFLLTAAVVAFLGIGLAHSAVKSDFSAKLNGNQESPPVKTKAHATAYFNEEKNNDVLHYKLKVDDIKNVTEAHLHLGAKGENGEPVAVLHIAKPQEKSPERKISGRLAEGTLTASDLKGPLAGKSISDLEEKIKAGEVYVNVHTSQNENGEIRGQVR